MAVSFIGHAIKVVLDRALVDKKFGNNGKLPGVSKKVPPFDWK